MQTLKTDFLIFRPVCIEDLTSVHVLLILLNDLRKTDKMLGLPSILSLFCNKFNKFNNTGSRTLDSIYCMKLRLF